MTASAPSPGPDPARVYEENAELLYAVARYFLPEDAAGEAVEAIATDLFTLLPSSGFTKYAKLLGVKAAFAKITTDPRAKVPRELVNAAERDGMKEPSLAEAFTLLLRDRFGFACNEIAAITASSEGSIRTRLERVRARLFNGGAPLRDGSARAPSISGAPPRVPSISGNQNSHFCTRVRELIEDWNISGARLGQFTTPAHVAKAIGDCPRCSQLLETRLGSLEHFQDLDLAAIPERLRAFPVSPLFIKEGKRVLLNWSAAPWYLKALFEGLLATTLVLGIVLSIPRVKGIYEFWLERRLDLYSIAELAAGLGSGRSESATELASGSSAGPAGTATALATTGNATSGPGATGASHGPGNVNNASAAKATSSIDSATVHTVTSETEFVGREADIASSDRIYRILIKTDSPEAQREQVLRLLSGAHYTAADTDAPPGSELPGGVIFDVFVPLKSYKPLSNELGRLGETRKIITRAKQRGIPGKAHLKIWLQRI